MKIKLEFSKLIPPYFYEQLCVDCFVPYTTYNNNEQCKPSGIKLSFFVVHFERKVNKKNHASAMRKHRERLSLVPGCSVGCDFETTRVTDEFIQDADNLFKFRPVVSLLLPTVQHQLVESGRAVHGRGKAIALINSFYYLRGQNKHLGQDGGVLFVKWMNSKHSATHILIGHFPVWSFSIRHHFPKDNTITPGITG